MVATDEIVRLIAARDDAKQKEAEAKANKQHFENQLRAALGNHRRAVGGGYSVTLARQKGRVSLDQRRLKDEAPDVWAKYQKQGEDFETLRIKATD